MHIKKGDYVAVYFSYGDIVYTQVKSISALTRDILKIESNSGAEYAAWKDEIKKISEHEYMIKLLEK